MNRRTKIGLLSLFVLFFLSGVVLFAKEDPRTNEARDPIFEEVVSTQQFMEFNKKHRFLFSILDLNPAICRKPFFILQPENPPMTILLEPQEASEPYVPQSFLPSKEVNIGSNFLKIEGNNVYKSGNSTLLIPGSYLIRKDSPVRQEPQIILNHKN